jgi:hypothetical protein
MTAGIETVDNPDSARLCGGVIRRGVDRPYSLLRSQTEIPGRRFVPPTPEKYQTLVRNRVSQKRWHVSQVFERGLVNTLR